MSALLGHVGLLLGQAVDPATDPYFANVISLLHFDGANASTTFADEIGKTWTPAGNAQLSTTDPRFGTACGLFDGSGDSIAAAASADFDLLGAAFTIEFWFRLVSNTPNQCLIEIGPNTNNRLNVSISGGNIIVYSTTSGGGGSQRISATAPAAGSWHFGTLSKSGSTFTLWVNGVAVGTSSTSVYPTGSQACRIGNSALGSNSVNGRIDDVRITKGVTRYAANFAPPGMPFPDS